jgi:hypothetical protein
VQPNGQGTAQPVVELHRHNGHAATADALVAAGLSHVSPIGAAIDPALLDADVHRPDDL